MHEFNDVLEFRRSSVFSHFLKWINCLCREASKTDFYWLIKPHPSTNSLGRERMKELSQTCVEKLQQSYPQLNFISERISNNALLQLRPASAFTMYGAAAHEMALSGVPVVTCGDHPHIGFDFNHHAKTRQQLKALIQRADRLRMRISKNRYMNICSCIIFPAAPWAVCCESYLATALYHRGKFAHFHSETSLEYAERKQAEGAGRTQKKDRSFGKIGQSFGISFQEAKIA